MALLPDYINLVNSTTNAPAALNTSVSAVYALLGSATVPPTFSDANVATGAAIQASKVQNTAATLGGAGTQIVTKAIQTSGIGPFSYTAGGGWGIDTAAGNASSPAIVGAAQAMAIVAGKGLYKPTAGAGADITTITGGTEGQVIDLYIATNANLTITHTVANTLNTIHLFDATSRVSNVIGKFIHLWFTAVITGTGCWFEI